MHGPAEQAKAETPENPVANDSASLLTLSRKSRGMLAPWLERDGRNESFAYTEADRTVELDTFALGMHRRRPNDRLGGVFVVNGIVAAHQQYLALGTRDCCRVTGP